MRVTRARAATVVLAGLCTISGCSCVEPQPVVHVSPGTTVQAGQVVTFDSNQMPGEHDDGINSDTHLAWDLDGDGTFETEGGRVVQKRFDVAGTYSVTLDAAGLVVDNIFNAPIYVHGYSTTKIVVTLPAPPANNDPPTAAFTSTPDPGYTERDITFDASGSHDSDGHVVKYEWDWTDDGTYDESGTEPTATHKYDFAGAYPVRLRVTDDAGATNTTVHTINVQDGVPPGRVIARAATGASAAGAGARISLGLGKVKLTPGTTTASGGKLVMVGIRGRGRVSLRRAPRILGPHRSPRWAGTFALVQRGSGSSAKLSGQGYILVALTTKNRLCMAVTATASLGSASVTGRLAAAGGSGRGAHLRGAGSFSPKVDRKTTRSLDGRVKFRKVRKARRLPKACRTLARSLPH